MRVTGGGEHPYDHAGYKQLYPVSRDAKVNRVPLNASATIATPDVVTCCGCLR